MHTKIVKATQGPLVADKHKILNYVLSRLSRQTASIIGCLTFFKVVWTEEFIGRSVWPLSARCTLYSIQIWSEWGNGIESITVYSKQSNLVFSSCHQNMKWTHHDVMTFCTLTIVSSHLVFYYKYTALDIDTNTCMICTGSKTARFCMRPLFLKVPY